MKIKAEYLKFALGCVSLGIGLVATNFAVIHWVEREGRHYLLGGYARDVCGFGGVGAMIFGVTLIHELVLRNFRKGQYEAEDAVTIFPDVEKEEEPIVTRRKDKRRKRALAVVPIAICLLMLSQVTFSLVTYTATVTITPKSHQWLSGWDKCVKITIDHNDVVSTLANFPVIIYLSNSSGRNNDDVSFVFDELETDANRKKIAITTGDGATECYVEIDSWNSTNEEAWLWVNVPSINSSSDTALYLYYDKDHADNTDYVGDAGSAPAEKVWDSGFIFVSHTRDDPDTSHIRDSTSNGYVGTKSSANNPPVTRGAIGDAQAFDGVDDIVIDSVAHNIGTGDFTWSAWVKTSSSFNNINPIFTNGEYSPAWYTKTWNDNRWGYYFGGYVFADSILSTNTEYFLAVVRDNGTIRFYKDGATDGTGADSRSMANSLLAIGRSGVSWHGKHEYVDEPRFSTTARGAEWIKASYETGRDHLLDFGSEEIK